MIAKIDTYTYLAMTSINPAIIAKIGSFLNVFSLFCLILIICATVKYTNFETI